jgi:hypothetical protein
MPFALKQQLAREVRSQKTLIAEGYLAMIGFGKSKGRVHISLDY